MESQRLASALLSLLAASACGGTEPVAAPAPAERAEGPVAEPAPAIGPRIEASELVYEFGLVSDAKELTHAFSFTNTGDAELVVEKVKTSCSCTAADLSKDRYAPGESETIEVRWTPKGRGRQVQTVDLFTNAGGTPFRFRLGAEVDPKLRIDPVLIDFGTLELSQRSTREARLSSTDPNVEVLAVAPSSADFEVLWRPLGREGVLGTITVTLLGTAKPGSVTGAVQVDYRFHDPETKAAVESRQTVSVRAKVFGQLALEPTAFLVGRVDPGGEVHCAVRFRHRAGEPFTLTATLANPVPASLEVVTRELAPGTIEVVVQGSVGAHLDRITGLVRVQTSLTGEAEFELPVMGIVRAGE